MLRQLRVSRKFTAAVRQNISRRGVVGARTAVKIRVQNHLYLVGLKAFVRVFVKENAVSYLLLFKNNYQSFLIYL